MSGNEYSTKLGKFGFLMSSLCVMCAGPVCDNRFGHKDWSKQRWSWPWWTALSVLSLCYALVSFLKCMPTTWPYETRSRRSSFATSNSFVFVESTDSSMSLSFSIALHNRRRPIHRLVHRSKSVHTVLFYYILYARNGWWISTNSSHHLPRPHYLRGWNS